MQPHHLVKQEGLSTRSTVLRQISQAHFGKPVSHHLQHDHNYVTKLHSGVSGSVLATQRATQAGRQGHSLSLCIHREKTTSVCAQRALWRVTLEPARMHRPWKTALRCMSHAHSPLHIDNSSYTSIHPLSRSASHGNHCQKANKTAQALFSRPEPSGLPC